MYVFEFVTGIRLYLHVLVLVSTLLITNMYMYKHAVLCIRPNVTLASICSYYSYDTPPLIATSVNTFFNMLHITYLVILLASIA